MYYEKMTKQAKKSCVKPKTCLQSILVDIYDIYLDTHSETTSLSASLTSIIEYAKSAMLIMFFNIFLVPGFSKNKKKLL